jgi:hypothetical protein
VTPYERLVARVHKPDHMSDPTCRQPHNFAGERPNRSRIADARGGGRDACREG